MMLRRFLFAHLRELIAAAHYCSSLWGRFGSGSKGTDFGFSPSVLLPPCRLGFCCSAGLAPNRQIRPTCPNPKPIGADRERDAFEKVKRFAEATGPLSLQNREEVLSLARRTIQLVATHYRSDAAMPLATFTIPEALLLVERVSSRLRRAMLDMVPFSDRLTVAQLLWAYDSKNTASSLIKMGGDVYNAYRALRPVINPAGAILSEAQRVIFDAACDQGKDYLARRLTHLLVLEVGKAAIELYSGGLKHTTAELDEIATAAARQGTSSAGELPPLRILIAGQINAGKSSLLNALAQEVLAPVTPLPGPAGFSCFEGRDPEGKAFVFVDAPGLDASADATAALAEEAKKADIVLWTIAAHQPARDADVQGLKAFGEWFAARPELNRPPLLCVATHVDQLRPFAEWAPPYDIVAADRPKAHAIREAVQAIAIDLGISAGSVVPVSLRPDSDAYNLDALRARIVACLPEARYAQLSRAGITAGKGSWRKEMNRLLLGGRVLFGASE